MEDLPAFSLILSWSIVGASSIPLVYLVKSTLCMLVGFVLGFLGDAQKVKDYIVVAMEGNWICEGFDSDIDVPISAMKICSKPSIVLILPIGKLLFNHQRKSIVFHILLLFLKFLLKP